MANSKPSDPSKDSGRASKTQIVDNTAAKEAPAPEAKTTETKIGNSGTVKVDYR